ncbi:hypothetical protein [Pseudomonas sp. SMN5]|uniref:hypothetical protein n=1 Tax=Pseudomonas sp. SMN5 TaxID=3390198 RepID=UPI003F870D4C
MEYMAAQMDRQIEGAEQRHNAALEEGGNPAFPVAASEYGGHGTVFGLTIRDYFAAKAMQALIEGALASDSDFPQRENVSGRAWGYADAMLATRST